MSHDVKGAQKGPRVQCMLVRLSKVRHYLASADLFLNQQQLRLVAAFFFTLHFPDCCFALVFALSLFKLLVLFSAHGDCLILIYTQH